MKNCLINNLINLNQGINGTNITLKFSSNAIIDSNDENSFPHELLLTDTQTLRLGKTFTNNSFANVNLFKMQLPELVQLEGGFAPLSIKLMDSLKSSSGEELQNKFLANSKKDAGKLLVNSGLDNPSKIIIKDFQQLRE